ncbi:MAG: DUF6326 family protein [Paracoccaceae bacterium]
MSTRLTLTTIWIAVLFNMVFADILGFLDAAFLRQVLDGAIDGVVLTPGFVLLAAICIQVATAMVVLTCALPHRASRIANLIAAPFTILFVVGGGSLSPHYLLLAGVEVAALLWIVRLAWTWREDRAWVTA